MGKIIVKIFIIVVGGLILYLLQKNIDSHMSGNGSSSPVENQQKESNQSQQGQIRQLEEKRKTIENLRDQDIEHKNQALNSEKLIDSYAIKVEEIEKRIVSIPDGKEKKIARQIFSSIDKLFNEAESSGSLDSVTIILIDQLLIDLRKGRPIRKSLYMD